MEFINFTDSEILNVSQLDDEHKRMAHLINQIYSFVTNKKYTSAKKSLDSLIKEAKNHFITEDKMMTDRKFPGYISHKLEHDRFLNNLIKISEEHKSGKKQITLDDLKNFKNWFFNHLELSDRKLANFILANEKH